MENKRVVIAIIVIIILIVGIISGAYFFSGFSNKQTKLLTDETNKILQADITTENIDLDVKSSKNYAVVEKAIKEYVSELKNIYVEMDELNKGINPNNIFTADNIEDKDLSEIDDIINEYKEKSQDAVTKLESLLTEEKIAENINKRNILTRKDYYIELYNTIMTSDNMKKQYNTLEEKIKDEKSKLSEKLKQIDNISEFLKKNSDSWTIKDGKIQFTNLNRMTEYYGLLNKLTD